MREEWIIRMHNSGFVRNYAMSRCYEQELLDDYVGDIWVEILTIKKDDFTDYYELQRYCAGLIARYMTDNGRSRNIRRLMTAEIGYEDVDRTEQREDNCDE